MTIYSVGNQTELLTALGTAVGGDVIQLAAGDYGDLLVRNMTFESPVTIVSSTGTMAHFDTIRVSNVENLNFRSIDVGRALADGEPNYLTWVSVAGSNGIEFDSVHVHGSLDGNAKNDGYGMVIRDSENVTLANSEFQQLTRAVQVLESSNIKAINNEFHDLMVDGFNFSAVDHVLIDQNKFYDFYTNKVDHPDAIQFWTMGAQAGSSNIRITNNQIFQGNGDAIQGIFMRDENGSLPYQNVHISNNIVHMNESWNGITIYNGINVEIVHNSLLSGRTDSFELRIWLEDITNGSISGNLADYFGGDNFDVISSSNVFLNKNPAFYANLPNLDKGASTTVSDLLVEGIGYQLPVQRGDSMADTLVGTSLGQAISRARGGEQAQSSAVQAQEAVPADDDEGPADAPASTASAAVYSVAAIDDVELDLTPPKAPEQTEGAAGGLSDFLSEGIASSFAGDAAYSRTAIADQHFGGSAFDASTFGADSGVFDFGAYMRGSMAELLLHADMHMV